MVAGLFADILCIIHRVSNCIDHRKQRVKKNYGGEDDVSKSIVKLVQSSFKIKGFHEKESTFISVTWNEKSAFQVT